MREVEMIYLVAAYALKYSPLIIVALVATLVWLTR
jgi:hypothetical protein